MVLGIAMPRFWNPLHDGLIVWFYVMEGLLLPIALYITDPLFKEAVKQSFRRRSSKHASEYKGESVVRGEHFVSTYNALLPGLCSAVYYLLMMHHIPSFQL